MNALDRPASLTREEVLAVLGRHPQGLRQLGARSLALFGSVARGEGSASSDIDLLVELEPKTFLRRALAGVPRGSRDASD